MPYTKYMTNKKYRQLRVAVAVFVGTMVGLAISRDSYLLAGAGVLTGMVFMALVRSKAKITVDEREATVRAQAAQLTYAIFAPTIGIGAFLLYLFSSAQLAVVQQRYYYLESLGMVLAYITLFLIALYSISYHFLNRKYGGGGLDE